MEHSENYAKICRESDKLDEPYTREVNGMGRETNIKPQFTAAAAAVAVLRFNFQNKFVVAD